MFSDVFKFSNDLRVSGRTFNSSPHHLKIEIFSHVFLVRGFTEFVGSENVSRALKTVGVGSNNGRENEEKE